MREEGSPRGLVEEARSGWRSEKAREATSMIQSGRPQCRRPRVSTAGARPRLSGLARRTRLYPPPSLLSQHVQRPRQPRLQTRWSVSRLSELLQGCLASDDPILLVSLLLLLLHFVRRRSAPLLSVPAFIAVTLGQQAIYDVPGGYRAVMFDRFSGVRSDVRPSQPNSTRRVGDKRKRTPR